MVNLKQNQRSVETEIFMKSICRHVTSVVQADVIQSKKNNIKLITLVIKEIYEIHTVLDFLFFKISWRLTSMYFS